MKSFRRSCQTLMIFLATAAVLTTVLTMTEAPATTPANLERLPLQVGDFTGADIPVDQGVKDILETPNVLTRKYTSADGASIMLAIVYYEQYRVYFHMPEGCMVGRGSIMISKQREKITQDASALMIEANKLALKKQNGVEYVYYFFVSGDLITPSYPMMRLHLMTEHLKRRKTGAALVRFSTFSDNEQAEKSIAPLKLFIEQFSPLLRQHMS